MGSLKLPGLLSSELQQEIDRLLGQDKGALAQIRDQALGFVVSSEHKIGLCSIDLATASSVENIQLTSVVQEDQGFGLLTSV